MSETNQHRLAITEFLALLHKKQSEASKRFLALYKERRDTADEAKRAEISDKIRYWEIEAHTIGGLIGALNSCLRCADGGYMKELWSPGTEADSLIVLEAALQEMREQLRKGE